MANDRVWMIECRYKKYPKDGWIPACRDWYSEKEIADYVLSAKIAGTAWGASQSEMEYRVVPYVREERDGK